MSAYECYANAPQKLYVKTPKKSAYEFDTYCGTISTAAKGLFVWVAFRSQAKMDDRHALRIASGRAKTRKQARAAILRTHRIRH